MPAKSKKSKSAKVSKKSKSVMTVPVMESPMHTDTNTMPVGAKLTPSPKLNPKFLAGALILIGVGLLTYKFGPWFVPAIVDKTPITRWQLYSKMESTYGAQTLDDMVNEKVLDAAIKKTNVKVEKAKVDAEITKIEDQFKSMGGLDAALKSRGMTRADLVTQVTTQLDVEEILKDKTTPTDTEIQKYFTDNSKTLYKDKKLDDVKADITDTLKQTKLRDAFTAWFAEAKKGINIRTFAPTPAPVPATTNE